MKRKTTTLLLGITAIAALGIAYWQLCSYNEKEEAAALEDAAGEEILNIDTESLSTISFLVAGQEKTFCRREDSWILEQDETFPVDEAQILALAGQLTPLQAVRVLENAGDPSEYGLDHPQNELLLTDEEGTVTTFTIGDMNSSTGDVYAMLNEDASIVYTIDSEFLASFSDDLYDYAYSDEMPLLQVSEIIGVSVETEAGGYELYLEDAQWQVRELRQSDDGVMLSESVAVDENKAAATETDSSNPDDSIRKSGELTGESKSADQETVNNAMSSLGSLVYADFVEHNCTDDSKYGFEETDTVLTISYQVEAQSETAAVLENKETETEYSSENTETSAELSSEEGSTEIEIQKEKQKEKRSVSFRIGATDDLGNYYVQMTGSAGVHTLDSSVIENFLGKTMQDWGTEREN